MASVQGGTGSQLLFLERIPFCASVHCLDAHSSVLSDKTPNQGNQSLTAAAESRRQQGIDESHCQALGSDAVQRSWECQTLLQIDLANI